MDYLPPTPPLKDQIMAINLRWSLDYQRKVPQLELFSHLLRTAFVPLLHEQFCSESPVAAHFKKIEAARAEAV